MTRLVGTELRRFFARRTVRGLLAFALGLVAFINVVQFARAGTTPATAPQSVTFSNPGSEPVSPFVTSEPQDRRPKVGGTFEGTIRGVNMALVVLAFVAGATLLAADYGASLGTQLIFEPRRVRLFAAKWLAAGIGAALLTLAVLTAAGAAQWVISAARGSTAGVDAAWLGHRAVDELRGAGACALAAMLALAVSAFTRRTVGTVAALFGALIAVRFLLAVSWGRTVVRLSPTNALWGVAYGRFESKNVDFFGGLHTMAGAWFLTLVWAAATLVAGAWWFTRQEIR